jgi:hypothetical protein
MLSRSARRLAGVIFLLVLCLPLALRAQLSKEDQEKAKGMISGTLYLRLDVPLRSEMGNWGSGSAPLLEVSPTGHDTSRLLDAFNQTFSKVPLQDEHPEWPADVRTAIAEHRLIVGMIKEQAFEVVGTPLDVKIDDANGVHTEIWHPRQDKGQALNRRGNFEDLGSTGFPVQLKFVDGKLQVIQ